MKSSLMILVLLLHAVLTFAARVDVMELAGDIATFKNKVSKKFKAAERAKDEAPGGLAPHMMPQMMPHMVPDMHPNHFVEPVHLDGPSTIAAQTQHSSIYAAFMPAGPPDKIWLEEGLGYHSNSKLPQGDQDYLAGTAAPPESWPASQQWQKWLTVAMEKLPVPEAEVDAVQVDDHKGTPIGEGDSIGLVAASVTMNSSQLDLLPPDFQSGLFKTCGGACATWPSAVRVSHTQAAGVDLMRIALKMNHPEFGEVDLHFTETLKSFPIDDRIQLEAFSYSIEHGQGWALVHYPVAMAKMGYNAYTASSKYKEAAKQYGVLGKDYYSLTPYLIGGKGEAAAGAMKWRLVPAVPFYQLPLFPETEEGADVKQSLRSQFVEQVSAEDHVFNLEIQVATDPVKHPLNSASTEWEEATAPWFQMGSVRIPQQSFQSSANPELANAANVVGSGLWTEDGKPPFSSKELIFEPCAKSNPHRPLGDINAFRAMLYPHYDKARQMHLLKKANGAAAKCPFAAIGKWLR